MNFPFLKPKAERVLEQPLAVSCVTNNKVKDDDPVLLKLKEHYENSCQDINKSINKIVEELRIVYLKSLNKLIFSVNTSQQNILSFNDYVLYGFLWKNILCVKHIPYFFNSEGKLNENPDIQDKNLFIHKWTWIKIFIIDLDFSIENVRPIMMDIVKKYLLEENKQSLIDEIYSATNIIKIIPNLNEYQFEKIRLFFSCLAKEFVHKIEANTIGFEDMKILKLKSFIHYFSQLKWSDLLLLKTESNKDRLGVLTNFRASDNQCFFYLKESLAFAHYNTQKVYNEMNYLNKKFSVYKQYLSKRNNLLVRCENTPIIDENEQFWFVNSLYFSSEETSIENECVDDIQAEKDLIHWKIIAIPFVDDENDKQIVKRYCQKINEVEAFRIQYFGKKIIKQDKTFIIDEVTPEGTVYLNEIPVTYRSNYKEFQKELLDKKLKIEKL